MRRQSLVLACLALAACATQPPRSEAELLSRHGPPSEQWEQPDGTRALMYADTPMGYGSTRYVVDRNHAIVAVEPVINEEHFARITPGLSQEQVRRELGRPGEVRGYSRLNETVWSWRYIDFGDRHMFFNAHFDAGTGTVNYTSRSEEYFHPRIGIGAGFGF
jgi:hypothetical protein